MTTITQSDTGDDDVVDLRASSACSCSRDRCVDDEADAWLWLWLWLCCSCTVALWSRGSTGGSIDWSQRCVAIVRGVEFDVRRCRFSTNA